MTWAAGEEPVSETDLLAYVDGHLDPARRRLVEGWLAGHPQAARRVAADMAINEAIRRLYGTHYEEEVPERLKRALHGRGEGSRRLRPAVRAVASVAMLVAVGAGGWVIGRSEDRQPTYAAIEDFPFSPVSGIRMVEALATEPATWLGESLRRAAEVPDLSGQGFRLVNQVLVGDPSRPAVQLTFADDENRLVHLYLHARWERGSPQVRYRQADGRTLVYWADGPVVFALTGDLPGDSLRMIAHTIQQAPPAAAEPPKPAPSQAIVPVAGGG